MKYWFMILLACVAILGEAKSQIIINEVLPSNYQTLLDDNYEASDYIELYNSSDEDINLSGWRIDDNSSFGKAFLLPDTVIKAKSFITIFASEHHDKKFHYCIKNTSLGIDHSGLRDEFHYEYLPIQGDFTAEMSFQAIRNESKNAVAGIMLRKEIDIESEHVGIFCQSQERSGIFTIIREKKNNNAHYVFPALMIQYPEEKIYLERRGDSVFTRYIFADSLWEHSAIKFPARDGIYFGLAVSSGSREATSEFVFNYLKINGQNIDFSKLIKKEVGELSQSETYDLNEIHVDFSLNNSAERVYLWNPAGKLISSIYIPKNDFGMPCDVAYGRKSDGSLAYMLPPTPNAENANFYTAIAQAPEFVFKKQWSNSPAEVSILCGEPGAEIYYTTNGDTPSKNSILYTMPILIKENTVLRAIAVKNDYLDSRIVTKTFFIGDSSSLPVISIAVDSASLWNEATGLFVEKNIHTAPEVPANYELFDLGKKSIMSSDCGLHLHGNVTRIFPQKSLRFTAKKHFGPSEWTFPFFDLDTEPITNAFILRNAGTDWKAAFLRDGIMGLAAKNFRTVTMSRFKSYLSFINGKFQGLYNMRERIDEKYLANKYKINEKKINLIGSNNELMNGSFRPYHDFVMSLDTVDASTKVGYEYLKNNVDEAALIDYLFGNLYCFNYDWVTNNVKVWNSAEYDGKFRWIFYDLDFGLGWQGAVPEGDFMPFIFKADTSYLSKIACKFLENNDFKNEFCRRSCDLLNTDFSAERMTILTDSLADIIRKEIPRQQAKWTESCQDWHDKVETIKWWINERQRLLPQTYADYFNLPGVAKLNFSENFAGKCCVRLNSVLLDSFPWSGYYLQGVPVTMTLEPNKDFAFYSWIVNGDTLREPTITFLPDSVVNIDLVRAKAGIAADELAEIYGRVYPNPIQNDLTLELNSPKELFAEIEICDMLGNCLLGARTILFDGDNSIKISAGGLACGVYVLRVKSNDTQVFSKAVVIAR